MKSDGPCARSHPRIAALFETQATNRLAGVLITEIEDNGCRAPLWSDDGSPSVAEARYCGRTTRDGSPWCEHHHRLFSAGPVAAVPDPDLDRLLP